MLKLTRKLFIIVLVSAAVATSRAHIDADITVPPTMRHAMLSMPRPVYPDEALVKHITGRGECDIFIDVSSGRATRVSVVQSSGSPILDAAAKRAFLRWRARPGKISRLRVPFTFTFPQ